MSTEKSMLDLLEEQAALAIETLNGFNYNLKQTKMETQTMETKDALSRIEAELGATPAAAKLRAEVHFRETTLARLEQRIKEEKELFSQPPSEELLDEIVRRM